MTLPLSARILLTFMPLVTAILAIVGTVAYVNGSRSLEDAAISELVAKSSEIAADLDRWLNERFTDVRQAAIQPDLLENVAQLIAAPHGTQQARAARAFLQQEFEPYLTDQNTTFAELLIIAPESGEVIASTNPAEEGKSKRDYPYFAHGKTELYLQSPYLYAGTKTPTMTIATPLRASDGRVLAVFAIHLKLTTMDAIVQRRIGLRRTEDAFLVNAERYPVTQPRFLDEPVVLRRQFDTVAVRNCAERTSGVNLTADYRGVPSIAVCRWIARQQFGLIVKIDQAEAFAPVRAFRQLLLLIVGLTLPIAAVIAFLLARSLSRPLRDLTNGVRNFAAKNFQDNLTASANDEVAALTQEFALMAARVVERDAELASANTGLQKQITERKQLEQQVLLAAKAFASIAESILITDANKNIIFANEAFVKASGYEVAEVIGRTPAILKSGRHDAAFYTEMWRQMSATDRWQGEVWDQRKDGSLFPVLLSLSTVRDETGMITHYVGVQSDISAAKRHASELEHKAQHDALTGLANRLLFSIRVEAALARARRTGNVLGLLFIDLDRFKIVNDTLGHAIGDALLRHVSERLGHCIRSTDTAARFGGDEFAVLLDLLESRDGSAIVAQKIIAALAMVFVIEGHDVSISASIGISLFPADGDDAETLMKCADAAMYAAKAAGRNAFRFYSEMPTLNAPTVTATTSSNAQERDEERGHPPAAQQNKSAT